MSEGVVTAVSYLSAFIGLGSTFAYLATFYLTPYNQLYLPSESGSDDTDVSYTLAIVECAISGSTFIVGVLAFAAAKSPPRRVVLVAMLFFIVSVVLEGTFSTIRAWNLGLVGTDMERTCSDIGVFTGCPTTRYASKHSPREILYTSPNGGDCQFWFWDEMRPRWQETSCGSDGLDNPKCDHFIETYMDWSSPGSYGWRDDPKAIKELLEGSGSLTTIDKVHNMAELMIIQANTTGIQSKLTTQPSLAYCWYWGCNSVCNSHRYLINRLWLMVSISLTVLHLVNTLMAAAVWRRKQEKPEAAVELVDAIKAQPFFVVPAIGRRKRRLVPTKNPSLLQF